VGWDDQDKLRYHEYDDLDELQSNEEVETADEDDVSAPCPMNIAGPADADGPSPSWAWPTLAVPVAAV
jgi:hypothetical protein